MEIDTISRKLLRKIGLKLREVREKKDMTLEDAEEASEVSWQYIQKIESGRNTTVAMLSKICRGYRVSLEELFKGT